VVATLLLIAGCSLEVLAVIGLVTMRSVYDRLHYVGLAGYGALLVGAAILVRESFSLIGDKAFATGALFIIVGPILVHTTARSLRIRQHRDWRENIEEHREEDRP
jgi:multisubunit Na+/H+ antiporter MnhG subunit